MSKHLGCNGREHKPGCPHGFGQITADDRVVVAEMEALLARDAAADAAAAKARRSGSPTAVLLAQAERDLAEAQVDLAVAQADPRYQALPKNRGEWTPEHVVVSGEVQRAEARVLTAEAAREAALGDDLMAW